MNSASPSLVDKREETYFVVLLVISILAWAIIALTCVGLPYALLIGLFLWVANGLLVARLRAEAVEISAQQTPELLNSLHGVCARLELATIPRLYVIQQGGSLNAFTTRHSSRNFIVLFSDMLEACGPDSPEVRFVLGHEIGHIQRNHVLKNLFLIPGRILPLIGDAYSRACERTCDRHGAFAAADPDGAVRAMMILSAGREYGKTMVPEAFAAQHLTERGFFVSWHELISAYPTLSQRVSNLLAWKTGAPPLRAKRHPLAYFFALLTLSGPGGGLSSLLLTIFMLAILFSIMAPAIEATREKAREEQQVDAAQVAENERILAAGKIDPAFVGAWDGGSAPADANEDYLRWKTIRKADGTLVTHYEKRDEGKVDKWSRTGSWRILDSSYYEVFPNGESRGYAIRAQKADAIEFVDDPVTPGSTFIETRVAE